MQQGASDRRTVSSFKALSILSGDGGGGMQGQLTTPLPVLRALYCLHCFLLNTEVQCIIYSLSLLTIDIVP